VNVKNKDVNKKVKIHPKYSKPQTTGLNEELPDSGSLFDENVKKKFLKAIQTKDR